MSEEAKPVQPETLPNDQFIRLQAINLAQGWAPALLQVNQGNVEKARAQMLKLAKVMETFVSSGKIVGTFDSVRETE